MDEVGQAEILSETVVETKPSHIKTTAGDEVEVEVNDEVSEEGEIEDGEINDDDLQAAKEALAQKGTIYLANSFSLPSILSSIELELMRSSSTSR
jgi:hypothetical protein